MKADVIDGFYRIGLRPIDMPKPILVYPSDGIGEELVWITLTLPMGYNKPPLILCTSM